MTPIRDGKTERVHCARIMKYRDSLLGKDEPKELLEFAESNESRYEVVETIKEIGEDPDGLFVLSSASTFPT